MKYLLAVMHSSSARDFLRANRRSNIHLYPDDWKQLPIPDVPSVRQAPIVALVEQILTAKRANPAADLTAFEADLNARVAVLYGLTPDEIRLVEASAPSSGRRTKCLQLPIHSRRVLPLIPLSLTSLLPHCYPCSRESPRFYGKGALMGQVHMRVILTNHREAVMARLGQLNASQVHRYETEALIDTGVVRSAIPAAVADRLGLLRMRRTDAKYADGRVEEVDVTEALTIEILGRETETNVMVLGEHILLGVTVLEELDLMVDCHRQRLVPYQGTFDQPVFRI